MMQILGSNAQLYFKVFWFYVTLITKEQVSLYVCSASIRSMYMLANLILSTLANSLAVPTPNVQMWSLLLPLTIKLNLKSQKETQTNREVIVSTSIFYIQPMVKTYINI